MKQTLGSITWSYRTAAAGILLSLCASASLVSSFSAAQEPHPYVHREQARDIVKQFASQLKPELVSIMRTDGPVAAIKVCAERAPEIAASLSEQTGWQVKRVSLKARNQITAIPDEWEQQILRSFEKSAVNGIPIKPLFAELQNDKQYRYMQAQPVGALCLHCHGSNLTPGIKKALAETYPKDIATGYQLNQIRGAFSLVLQLPEAAEH
ncbi:DUF3365 domain-containing protein [Neiella marina]|uniref:DUF3365 domain-containing protein n=1 Tax=Neiella holothuriorum TaxID=2870530 RepID=A0ABS7EE02_9GAMM|nr:DUF3365 domain-containing protein [Neiella holothuriorum]MBW8190475.1 DUF3365 domain-containing protein [Neiella holothuriorum]